MQRSQSPIPISSFMDTVDITSDSHASQTEKGKVYTVGLGVIKAMQKVATLAPQSTVKISCEDGKPMTIRFLIGFMGELEFIISN